ncbi:two-component response regulator ARR22-like [Nicotiana tabacum]|uniref:Two-component response regulator ARR22-like n=1 Tax=Nicotiana tabacum TaxID=4097 RepID=A0A1S4DL87_TOBAC|nr:PREDICTED: two-component response regulator ARR22-like [Nicotiana tabacum]
MSSSASASSSKSKKRVGPENDFKVGKQLKVLIVDDDDVSQTTYILFLQKCGVETLGVRNGNVAVNIHDITQMRFDLIFMNSVLPLMDGIRATKKLREMGITTMIVGMTNVNDKEEVRKEFMEAGLDDCYEKPLTPEIFRSLLEKLSNKA